MSLDAASDLDWEREGGSQTHPKTFLLAVVPHSRLRLLDAANDLFTIVRSQIGSETVRKYVRVDASEMIISVSIGCK